MYLSELKLWNYRKYTDADGSTNENDSHLIMSFTKGLNVLVGENDLGRLQNSEWHIINLTNN